MKHSNPATHLQDYVDRRLESMQRKSEEWETRVELQIARQNDALAEQLRRTSQGEANTMQPDVQRIEAAVNEWTKSAEEQLNVLHAVMIELEELG